MGYNLRIVRRLLSIALLVAFGLPLAAPLFASTDADTLLPACCRRNGMHYCMRPASMPGPGWSATPMKCPLYPRAVAQVRGRDVALAVFGLSLDGIAVSSSVVVAVETVATNASLHTHSGRGPPSLTV